MSSSLARFLEGIVIPLMLLLHENMNELVEEKSNE